MRRRWQRCAAPAALRYIQQLRARKLLLRFCGRWPSLDPTPKPPNELLGPRSDSNIRLVLESIDYVDNSTWFETCCCTDKGDISYTPTRNAIFDAVVDKATAREKINIISCSSGNNSRTEHPRREQPLQGRAWHHDRPCHRHAALVMHHCRARN